MAIKDRQDYAIPVHDLSYVTILTNNQVVRDLVFVRLFFFFYLITVGCSLKFCQLV